MSEYIIDWDENLVTDTFSKNSLREEIVRCRDCTRFVPQGTYRFNSGVVNKATCDVIRGFVVQIDPDGFCAWGERRSE